MQSNQELVELLRERAPDLVKCAVAELHRARLQHYEEDGLQATRDRLALLLDRTLTCLETGRAEPIMDWAIRVGLERFSAGFDLFEVQTSINVMEEAIWRRVLSSMGPGDLAHALGLVNALLSMAKDKVAREYVALVTHEASVSVNNDSSSRTMDGEVLGNGTGPGQEA